MNCQDIQRRILAGRREDPEVQTHLAACADCRTFAEVVEVVESAPLVPLDPPAELDAAVLRAARRREAGPARVRRSFVLRILAPAAAAAALVVAGVLWWRPPEDRSASTTVANLRPPLVNRKKEPEAQTGDAVIDDALLLLQAEMTVLNHDAAGNAANDALSKPPPAPSEGTGIDDTLLRLDAEIFLMQEQLERTPESPEVPPNADASHASGETPA